MSKPVCVVTGSSSGIGAATALLFAERGYRVVINYSREAAPAENIAARCRAVNAEVLIVKADIAEDAQCRALAEAVRAEWGQVDVLVNNAGTTKFADIKDLDALAAEDFLRIYHVNVVGAFQMSRAIAPLMAGVSNACIINISSIASLMGSGSSIAYAASKGGVNTLTLALARALGPAIRVNAILPGMVDSPWLRNGLGEQRFEAQKQRYESRALLKAVLDPQDAARAAFYLAHDATKVTGQLLQVDAGFTAG